MSNKNYNDFDDLDFESSSESSSQEESIPNNQTSLASIVSPTSKYFDGTRKMLSIFQKKKSLLTDNVIQAIEVLYDFGHFDDIAKPVFSSSKHLDNFVKILKNIHEVGVNNIYVQTDDLCFGTEHFTELLRACESDVLPFYATVNAGLGANMFRAFRAKQNGKMNKESLFENSDYLYETLQAGNSITEFVEFTVETWKSLYKPSFAIPNVTDTEAVKISVEILNDQSDEHVFKVIDDNSPAFPLKTVNSKYEIPEDCKDKFEVLEVPVEDTDQVTKVLKSKFDFDTQYPQNTEDSRPIIPLKLKNPTTLRWEKSYNIIKEEECAYYMSVTQLEGVLRKQSRFKKDYEVYLFNPISFHILAVPVKFGYKGLFPLPNLLGWAKIYSKISMLHQHLYLMMFRNEWRNLQDPNYAPSEELNFIDHMGVPRYWSSILALIEHSTKKSLTTKNKKSLKGILKVIAACYDWYERIMVGVYAHPDTSVYDSIDIDPDEFYTDMDLGDRYNFDDIDDDEGVI
jgi:hypothetical protein